MEATKTSAAEELALLDKAWHQTSVWASLHPTVSNLATSLDLPIQTRLGVLLRLGNLGFVPGHGLLPFSQCVSPSCGVTGPAVPGPGKDTYRAPEGTSVTRGLHSPCAREIRGRGTKRSPGYDGES